MIDQETMSYVNDQVSAERREREKLELKVDDIGRTQNNSAQDFSYFRGEISEKISNLLLQVNSAVKQIGEVNTKMDTITAETNKTQLGNYNSIKLIVATALISGIIGAILTSILKGVFV